MPVESKSTADHGAGPMTSGDSIHGSLRAAFPLVFVVLVAGCSEANRYVEPPPPEVTVVRPVRRAVTDYLEATGTAQPVMSVDIRRGSGASSRSGISARARSVKAGPAPAGHRRGAVPAGARPGQAAAGRGRGVAARRPSSREAREVARAQLALDLSQLNLAQTAEARAAQPDRPERRHARGDGPGRGEPQEERGPGRGRPAPARAGRGRLRDQHPRRRGQRRLGADGGPQRRDRAGLLPDVRPHRRPDQPDQLPRRQPRRRRPGVAAGDDRQDRPDLCVHQRQRGRPAPLPRAWSARPAASRHRARPRCRWSWAWPTNGATRTGARSTTRTPPPTRAPAPSGCAGSSPTPTARSCRDSSSASASPPAGARTRCSSPSGPSGPTRRASSCWSSGEDDVVEYRPVKAGARIDGLRVVEGKIGPDDRVVVDGLLQARPRLKVIPIRRPRPTRPTPSPTPASGRPHSPLKSDPGPRPCSRASSSSGRSSPTSSRS